MTQHETQHPRRTSRRRALTGLAAASLGAAGLALTGGSRTATAQGMMGSADEIIQSWPEMPKMAARTLIAQYGQPHELTASQLIWHENGPWKRTILYRDEIPHHFPKPHTDFLEQVIDYQVPTDKFDDLAAYDGSVIVERTKGEISARCDKEGLNFLALNLAHEIVTGSTGVDQARKTYGENAMKFLMGEVTPLTAGLQFMAPDGGTADTDMPLM